MPPLLHYMSRLYSVQQFRLRKLLRYGGEFSMPNSVIDVKELARKYTVEELNRAAEEYLTCPPEIGPLEKCELSLNGPTSENCIRHNGALGGRVKADVSRRSEPWTRDT